MRATRMSPEEWGLRLSDMVAGFCGGLSYVFVARQVRPAQAIGSVVVGTLTANYLGELVAHMLSIGVSAGGYVTGLGAMAICQGVIEASSRWRFGSTISGGGK